MNLKAHFDGLFYYLKKEKMIINLLPTIELGNSTSEGDYMKKYIIGIMAAMVLTVSSNVFASGGSNGAGGFGQTYCHLSNNETVFVPWFICKQHGGKSYDF